MWSCLTTTHREARIKAKLCSYCCCWSVINWLIQLTHFRAIEEITRVSLVNIPIVLLHNSTPLPHDSSLICSIPFFSHHYSSHSILSILTDKPLPLFQIPPMSHCSFPFCTPDSHAWSLCFLSTITSFSHHIVLSVVWRNVYKDSVHPLVKWEQDVFSQVQYQFQLSQVYSSISSVNQDGFTYPLTGRRGIFLFFSY